jgi:hypothetical protein
MLGRDMDIIILELIIKEQDVRVQTVRIHLAKDMVLWWVVMKHGNKPSSLVKGRDFLD